MSYWNNSNGIPFQREYIYNPNAPNFIPPSTNFNNAGFSGQRNYVESQHNYNNVTADISQQSVTNLTMGEAAASSFYHNPDNINVVLNVSHSNLTPTATEFTPSNSQSKGSQSGVTTGAVRKKQFNKSKPKPTTVHKTPQNNQEPCGFIPNTSEYSFNRNKLGWSRRTSGNHRRDNSPSKNNYTNTRFSERQDDYQKRFSYRNENRRYQNREWNGRTYKRNNNKHDESGRNVKDQKEPREENKNSNWRNIPHDEDRPSKPKIADRRTVHSADYLRRKCKYAKKCKIQRI